MSRPGPLTVRRVRNYYLSPPSVGRAGQRTGLRGHSSEEGDRAMAKSGKHRLILCNDGGPLLGPNVEAPIGADGLERLVIAPLVGTQVDTLYWQLGTDPYLSTPSHRFSDIYSHRTDVGPRWGEEQERFTSAGNWRIYENTRQLIEGGTDPPEVVIEGGHRAGLDVFLSFRVNDVHDGTLEGESPELLSPVKRAHPDWLLGPSARLRPEHRALGLSRFAYDFAVPEVREYKLALAREAIESYDLDGLDWDFCRFPRLFREGEAVKNAGLITEMLHQVRAALDAKARRVGRRLYLSVRVPPTIELAGAFGLDVRGWIDDGVVDILVVGVVHSSMYRAPVESFVEAARGSNVEVIAQNLGLFWFGRPNSARVLWHEQDVFSPAMCRASAATYWRAGVDGIYLWNNQIIEFSRDAAYDREPWKEIADPRLIARRDKHYLVDKPDSWQTFADELGEPPVPPGPLPVDLSDPGDIADIQIDVADDVAGAVAENALAEATLRLMIVNLTARDQISFELNGTPVDRSAADVHLMYNDCWLDFDVSRGPLTQGWNRLRVEVLERNPLVDAPLTLDSVEVLVRYQGSPR